MQNQFLFNCTKGGTLPPPVLHGGIGTKAGRAHENNSCLKKKLFVDVDSFTADSDLLQPTGGVNSTPHTSPFSRSQRARIMMCDTTLAQSVGARHPIHVSCA